MSAFSLFQQTDMIFLVPPLFYVYKMCLHEHGFQMRNGTRKQEEWYQFTHKQWPKFWQWSGLIKRYKKLQIEHLRFLREQIIQPDRLSIVFSESFSIRLILDTQRSDQFRACPHASIVSTLFSFFVVPSVCPPHQV